MKKILLALFLTVPCVLAQVALCEELDSIFKKVNDLVATKNYSKALEELGWAKKAIEKLHMGQLQSFLLDKLAGYDGDKVKTNSALGFMEIERNYTKPGESSSVKISLTGGSGGAGAGGLQGLAALGQMAAMMGQQTGQDTLRISGRTASLQVDEDQKQAELTVFLDSGSVLKFEMRRSSKSEVLKSMAEELKLNDIDTYLKG